MHGFLDILGLPFVACLVMVSILGYVGIHVLKREIIFIDIALAQIVAVGAIASTMAFDTSADSLVSFVCSLGAAFAAAIFYAWARRRAHQISIEAIIGISYGIAAAAALFLLGIGPGGHVHVQHMLAGSILWATWTDILWCALVFSAVGLCFGVLRKPFRKISEDYEGSIDEGVKVIWWDFAFYVLVGTVITVAVRIGGIVVVFAFLIIPATISALFASRWGSRVLVAWASGVVASVLGLLFADRLDFSVGPSVALFLGVVLSLAALVRTGRGRLGGTLAIATVAGFVTLLWVRPPANVNWTSRTDARIEPTGTGLSEKPPTVEGEAADEPALSGTVLSEQVNGAQNADQLAVLFAEARGAEIRSDIVCRIVRLDARKGGELALILLAEDPPLFFRQVVVDTLNEAFTASFPFDVTRPFSAPENQKAAARLREKLGGGAREPR